MKYSLFVFCFFALLACKKKQPDPASLPTTLSVFREHGLDVCWDQGGSDRIAYSIKESDQYYDIHFALPNGVNDVCLTCNHSALPNKHICTPYWHPSGKWLLMAVEKATHPGSSVDALPGFGAYCAISGS